MDFFFFGGGGVEGEGVVAFFSLLLSALWPPKFIFLTCTMKSLHPNIPQNFNPLRHQLKPKISSKYP